MWQCFTFSDEACSDTDAVNGVADSVQQLSVDDDTSENDTAASEHDRKADEQGHDNAEDTIGAAIQQEGAMAHQEEQEEKLKGAEGGEVQEEEEEGNGLSPKGKYRYIQQLWSNIIYFFHDNFIGLSEYQIFLVQVLLAQDYAP